MIKHGTTVEPFFCFVLFLLQYKTKISDEMDLKRRIQSLEESMELHERMKRQALAEFESYRQRMEDMQLCTEAQVGTRACRKRADSTTCVFNARPLSRWRWIPGPSVHQLYLREVRILQIWEHCHSGQLMTFAASQCFSREGGIEPCCCVPSYMATRTPGSRDQLPIMTVHPIYEKQNWTQKPSLRKVYPKRIKIKQMSLMCSLIIILAMNYITDEVI